MTDKMNIHSNKIALVLPGSIWYAPYVRNYTRILDESKIEYAIISWNREGDDKPEGFQYDALCEMDMVLLVLLHIKAMLSLLKEPLRSKDSIE